jgi:tetratricopeptide (TPR) repeat protein
VRRAPRPVAPEIPEGVTGRDLDKGVYRQLSGLPLKVVERVAAHLVMAGNLADEDPETAYAHAKAARAEAARVAVVREAVGETAYACGKFSEALAELRAAKRLNGSWDYLPIMADCERALKRPERAIALSQEAGVANLDQAGQVEMTIVAAGARRDMGQLEAAIQLLETAPLNSKSRQPWVARLRYAYADALVAAGRTDAAITWFHRTVSVDSFAATDASDRAAELEKAVGTA